MTTRWIDSSVRKERSRESPLMSLCVVASMSLHECVQMADENFRESLNGKVVRGCRKHALASVTRRGRDEGRVTRPVPWKHVGRGATSGIPPGLPREARPDGFLLVGPHRRKNQYGVPGKCGLIQPTPVRMADFAVTCPLVPGAPPRIRFLFVAPRGWIGLPSDPIVRLSLRPELRPRGSRRSLAVTPLPFASPSTPPFDLHSG